MAKEVILKDKSGVLMFPFTRSRCIIMDSGKTVQDSLVTVDQVKSIVSRTLIEIPFETKTITYKTGKIYATDLGLATDEGYTIYSDSTCENPFVADALDAGTYKYYLKIDDTDTHQWDDYSDTVKTCTVVIEKKRVAQPTIPTSKTYDGNSLTYENSSDSGLYKVYGDSNYTTVYDASTDVSHKIGSVNLYAKLNDETNYVWAKQGDSSVLILSITIAKDTLKSSFTYKTPISINTTTAQTSSVVYNYNVSTSRNSNVSLSNATVIYTISSIVFTGGISITSSFGDYVTIDSSSGKLTFSTTNAGFTVNVTRSLFISQEDATYYTLKSDTKDATTNKYLAAEGTASVLFNKLDGMDNTSLTVNPTTVVYGKSVQLTLVESTITNTTSNYTFTSITDSNGNSLGLSESQLTSGSGCSVYPSVSTTYTVTFTNNNSSVYTGNYVKNSVTVDSNLYYYYVNNNTSLSGSDAISSMSGSTLLSKTPDPIPTYSETSPTWISKTLSASGWVVIYVPASSSRVPYVDDGTTNVNNAMTFDELPGGGAIKTTTINGLSFKAYAAKVSNVNAPFLFLFK